MFSAGSSDITITIFRGLLSSNGVVSTWVEFLKLVKLFSQDVTNCLDLVSILQVQILVPVEVGHQTVVI